MGQLVFQASRLQEWQIIRMDRVLELGYLENGKTSSRPVHVVRAFFDRLAEADGRPIVDLNVVLWSLLAFGAERGQPLVRARLNGFTPF